MNHMELWYYIPVTGGDALVPTTTAMAPPAAAPVAAPRA